jgi:uncharacterized protein (DUF2164 family)
LHAGYKHLIRLNLSGDLMNKKNKIELPKEKKDEMILKIKNYFLNERDEEIGDLASIMIFEFIIEELSAEFYNQGVYDSYKYMNDRCEDLLSIQKY